MFCHRSTQPLTTNVSLFLVPMEKGETDEEVGRSAQYFTINTSAIQRKVSSLNVRSIYAKNNNFTFENCTILEYFQSKKPFSIHVLWRHVVSLISVLLSTLNLDTKVSKMRFPTKRRWFERGDQFLYKITTFFDIRLVDYRSTNQDNIV